MDNEKIADWYDSYSERQYKTGTNERLISLYKRMKKWGLKADSKVLELGCGVGIFSRLLLKTVKTGKIEAVDLSPKSIEVAQKFVKNNNIRFETADVVNYTPKISGFDFITLMDVIEHIPLEKHPELFDNLAQLCNDKTLIIINFPNPRYIEFFQKNDPSQLQVIDQSVELPELVNIADHSGLEIVFYEKYSIWEREDYDFLVMRKKRPFKLQHLADSRNISEKVEKKITRKIDSIKYS